MRAESTVEAPVVFVGGGVTAPEQNYDDYKGVDVKGKIVAVLFEAPNFESSLKAHYSSAEVKAKNAVEHGAVGVIVLTDPILEKCIRSASRCATCRFRNSTGSTNNSALTIIFQSCKAMHS